MRRSLAALVFVAALLAAGCTPDSKHAILEKAEGVSTKAELEAALGAPNDRNKLGPIETWTYEAADGNVTFLITGDKVRLEATSPDESGEKED